MKPPKSIGAQIDLLKARGLLIPDLEVAQTLLMDSNYYRLSGYFREFQVDPSNQDNNFTSGTTLDEIVQVALEDERLSRILLDGLLTLEKVVRSRLAYLLAMQFDEKAFYLQPEFYLDVMPEREWFLNGLERQLRDSRSRTLRRYSDGEDFSEVPIWVAIEVFSFGRVAKIVDYGRDPSIKHSLADSFGFRRETFASTIHSLSVLRNACAHHGQIWHRRVDIQTPKIKHQAREWVKHDSQSVVPGAIALTVLLESIDPGCERAAKLREFFDPSMESVAFGGFAFPKPK